LDGKAINTAHFVMAAQLRQTRADMNRMPVLAPLVLVSTLAAACSGAATSPISPTNESAAADSGSSNSGAGAAAATDLLSGSWILVSVQSAGGPPQATPAGASYTLTFADGRLSTRVDCNMCMGAFTLSNQTLITAPAMACTRAACPTMEFGDTYTGVLAGESAVSVSGNSLTLSSARGVLRFER
jgi:heat shock protein HslJ